MPLEGGKVVDAYLAEMRRTADEVRASNRPEFGRMGERLTDAITALSEASTWLRAALSKNPDDAQAGAQPYLRLFGLAAGGTYLARGALAAVRDASAANGNAATYIALARFFAENLTTGAPGLKEAIVAGADATLVLDEAALGR